MDLNSLPCDILITILRKIDNVLFFLLVCKQNYHNKENVLKIFGLTSNFWILRYLGKYKENIIIFARNGHFLLTNQGICYCAKRYNQINLSKSITWYMPLNPVKKLLILKENGIFYHELFIVIVLFFNGTLEFISLRGKHTYPNIEVPKIVLSRQFSHQRKVILTGISDFILKDRLNLITISSSGILDCNAITKLSKTDLSIYNAKICHVHTVDLGFPILSFVFVNEAILVVKLDGEVVKVTFNPLLVTQLKMRGVCMRIYQKQIYVLDENKNFQLVENI